MGARRRFCREGASPKKGPPQKTQVSKSPPPPPIAEFFFQGQGAGGKRLLLPPTSRAPMPTHGEKRSRKAPTLIFKKVAKGPPNGEKAPHKEKNVAERLLHGEQVTKMPPHRAKKNVLVFQEGALELAPVLHFIF